MAKIKKVLKNKVFMGVGIIVLVVILLFAFKNGKDTKDNLYEIKRVDIEQSVLVSGTVKAEKATDLSFEKSGKVSKINKKVGDKVYLGEIIIALNSDNESANLLSAEGKVKSAEADLESVLKGSRIEEVAVKEAEYVKARQDLKNYLSSVFETINDTYNKSDNAINKQIDALFSNDQGPSPEITFAVGDQQNKTVAREERIKSGATLLKIKLLNESALSVQEISVDLGREKISSAISYLSSIQESLIKISAVLDDAIGLSDSTTTTYKDNINTARTNVNTALKSASSLLQNIDSSEAYLTKIEKELNLIKAGPTAEAVLKAESAVEIARAELKLAEANYRKNFIYSPINGIITKINPEIGEIVNTGEKIVSIISDKEFEVESQIPENDISKIKVGNATKITLDSYGDEIVFMGLVKNIDPAENIIDGMPAYKTIISINEIPSNITIRSGMTANIEINTERIEGVIAIPRNSIINEGDKKFVIVSSGRREEKREILTGLSGKNGMVEIKDGLKEGEKIILKHN